MDDTKLGYSEDELRRDLQTWWDDQVGGDDNPFAEPKSSADTIFDVLPEIDSLGVVTGLVTIEIHIGFEVSPHIIRRGGYRDFEDMCGDLLPKVRALVLKKRKEAA